MRTSVFGVAAVGLAVVAAYMMPASMPQASSSDTFRQLKLFGDVFERVRGEYVEDVTDEVLIETAINGMLTALDPHSGYLDAKKYRDMQVQTKGEFGGLGIEVTMEDGLVKVVSPIDDTPAHRAGIQAGDVITHIDSEPVLGMSLAEAVERMRGPVDTSIALTLRRAGQEEPIDVSMARAVITISPVRWHSEIDIGYIRITAFNEQTEEQPARGGRRSEDRDRPGDEGHRGRPAQQSRRPARAGGRGRRRLPRPAARSSRPAAGAPTASSASTPGAATSRTACRSSC